MVPAVFFLRQGAGAAVVEADDCPGRKNLSGFRFGDVVRAKRVTDDPTLLRRYAAERSETAFAELVRRHLPLVYSAALRRLSGDAHRAEDVAQAVFCAVARDAQRLAHHPVLAGWLYTATRNAVLDALRAEKRRRAREEEAHLMQETVSDPAASADWGQLRPVLDAAMDELNDDDREAVLLRFFQGCSLAEVGAALGLGEDAARKRVDRALDKLRGPLGRRGIASTSAALAALLASETMAAVPASLAASIAGFALSVGAPIGVASFLAMTKLQTGLAAVVIMGGAIGLVTQQRTIFALRETVASAERQNVRLAAENAGLMQTRATVESERAQLRAEIAPLKPVVKTAVAIGNNTSTAEVTVPRTTLGTPETRLQKESLHRRYDPFLQHYGLTAEQADRFVELKIAIYQAQDDLQAAVRKAGAQGGSDGVEKLRSKLVEPLWDEIRRLLGDEGYRAYGDYERLSGYRTGYVEPLLPAFASANAPLSPQQADELVKTFSISSHTVRINSTDISTRGIMDWNAVIAQARDFLNPAQLTVLQTYAERRKAGSQTP